MKQQPQPPVQMDQITAGASVVIWSTYPLLQLPDNWIVQQAACFFPPDCVRSHASRTVHTHPSWSPLNRGTSVSTRLQDRVQMFLLQPFFLTALNFYSTGKSERVKITHYL